MRHSIDGKGTSQSALPFYRVQTCDERMVDSHKAVVIARARRKQ